MSIDPPVDCVWFHSEAVIHDPTFIFAAHLVRFDHYRGSLSHSMLTRIYTNAGKIIIEPLSSLILGQMFCLMLIGAPACRGPSNILKRIMRPVQVLITQDGCRRLVTC